MTYKYYNALLSKCSIDDQRICSKYYTYVFNPNLGCVITNKGGEYHDNIDHMQVYVYTIQLSNVSNVANCDDLWWKCSASICHEYSFCYFLLILWVLTFPKAVPFTILVCQIIPSMSRTLLMIHQVETALRIWAQCLVKPL